MVIAEHQPDLCPHSNAKVREQFERIPEFYKLAKKLGVALVFAGIPVPEHKTFMVMRAANFESVRQLMVETGLVQTNTITIYRTESFEEFAEELKKTLPIF